MTSGVEKDPVVLWLPTYGPHTCTQAKSGLSSIPFRENTPRCKFRLRATTHAIVHGEMLDSG